jgi:hypothetical protein
MAYNSEERFKRICHGIRLDREKIVRHNPIGSEEEILLWMLLGTLVTYLSLSEMETPCISGRPDAATYRAAIAHVLDGRRADGFDAEPYIDRMLEL